MEDPRADLKQFLLPSPIATSVPPLAPLQQLAIQQAANRSIFGIPTPLSEQLAFQTATGQPLQQFIQGNISNTPAVQQAVQGVRSQVLPTVQNAYARMGLAQSPQLAEQEGRTMAAAVAPIYQQGMQNQLAATNSALQTLQSLGQREAARPIEALQEAQTFGGLQREARAQQLAAQVQEFSRLQNLLTGYINPFGNFNILSAPGPFESTQRTSPTGFGFFK